MKSRYTSAKKYVTRYKKEKGFKRDSIIRKRTQFKQDRKKNKTKKSIQNNENTVSNLKFKKVALTCKLLISPN